MEAGPVGTSGPRVLSHVTQDSSHVTGTVATPSPVMAARPVPVTHRRHRHATRNSVLS